MSTHFADTEADITFNSWTDLEHTMDSTDSYTFRVNYSTFIPDKYSQTISAQWWHSYTTVQNGYIIEEAQPSSSGTRFRTSNLMKSGTNLQSQFTIEDPILSTSGNYIFNVTAFDDESNITFILHVNSPQTVLTLISEVDTPSATVDPHYLEINQDYDVWCIGEGYPSPTPTLWWKPCVIDGNQTCSNLEWEKVNSDSSGEFTNGNVRNTSSHEFTYQLGILARTKAITTGSFQCTIDSYADDDNADTQFSYIVTDVPDAQAKQGFGIQPIPDKTEIYEFSSFSLSCKMQKYTKYDSLQWFFVKSDGTQTKFDQISVGYRTWWNITNPYSNDYVLTIDKMSQGQSGSYKCQAQRYKSDGMTDTVSDTIKITVIPSTVPFLGLGSSPTKITVNYSSAASIVCNAQGNPPPWITWYFNDDVLVPRTGITIENNYTEVKISRTVGQDQGNYKCSMENVAGNFSAVFALTVDGIPEENKKMSKTSVIILATCLAFLTTSVIILLCFVIYLKRRDKQRVSFVPYDVLKF